LYIKFDFKQIAAFSTASLHEGNKNGTPKEMFVQTLLNHIEVITQITIELDLTLNFFGVRKNIIHMLPRLIVF
jgi:hypothetical protein